MFCEIYFSFLKRFLCEISATQCVPRH